MPTVRASLRYLAENLVPVHSSPFTQSNNFVQMAISFLFLEFFIDYFFLDF
jgi:hypothetical protein